jgi:hypothetical protein
MICQFQQGISAQLCSDTFDRQQQVDAAALLVARHFTLGHPPEALIATLSHALLRENAGFHAYQMLEAGVRQFREWGNGDQGRHILIAVARYLAAHFPTQRTPVTDGRHLATADARRRTSSRGASGVSGAAITLKEVLVKIFGSP